MPPACRSLITQIYPKGIHSSKACLVALQAKRGICWQFSDIERGDTPMYPFDRISWVSAVCDRRSLWEEDPAPVRLAVLGSRFAARALPVPTHLPSVSPLHILHSPVTHIPAALLEVPLALDTQHPHSMVGVWALCRLTIGILQRGSAVWTIMESRASSLCQCSGTGEWQGFHIGMYIGSQHLAGPLGLGDAGWHSESPRTLRASDACFGDPACPCLLCC